MSRKAYIFTTSEYPNNVILNHIKSLITNKYIVTIYVPDRGYGDLYYKYYKNIELRKFKIGFSNKSFFRFLISLIKFILVSNFVVIKDRPELCLGVDFEGAMATFPANFLKTSRVLLVNDNFSIRYKIPKIISMGIQFFESISFIGHKFVILPHYSRSKFIYFKNLLNIKVINNIINSNPGITWISPAEKRILLCGWLTATRGLKQFLQLSKKFPNYEFLLVGDISALKIDFSGYKNISCIPPIPHRDMLVLMSECTINFAFYDPSIPINVYAQPQKIYDSLSIGAPLLVNSEMIFAKELSSMGCCLTASYLDLKQLCDVISSLNEDALNAISRNSINAFKDISRHSQSELNSLYL